VAGGWPDEMARPGGTIENLRRIPPSFQDGFILDDETWHGVPGKFPDVAPRFNMV
jgi:hypothetical protein